MGYIVPHSSLQQNNRHLAGRSPRMLADGWQGQAQWVMQIHMVCMALDWLGREVLEDPSRPNRGPIVDQIHLRYRGWDAATLEREWGKTKDGIGLAWCAEFIWVVVDDVCKKLGLANCLPGWAQALGRARDTVEKSRGRLPIVTWQDLALGKGITVKRSSGDEVICQDGWPEIGQIFYRTSQPQRQSSDSTGHMGIVVAVSPAGNYFETVEGNQGNSNRVALYRYTKQDLQRYSFEFIHVAECATPKDNPTGVLAPTAECIEIATGKRRILGESVCPPGWVKTSATGCECPAPKKINSFSECVACEPPYTWDEKTRTCIPPAGGSSAQPTQDCSLSSVIGKAFSSLTPAEKQKTCADITIKDINVGLLPHYSALKQKDSSGRRYVGADILGATYGIGGERHEFFGARNGTAVNRKHPARNGREEHTSVGIFRMRSGRLVYICAEGNLQWNNLWNNNLIGNGYGAGREPWRIHIGRIQGSNFAEGMAEVFAGEFPLNGKFATYLPYVVSASRNGAGAIVKGGNGGGSISNLLPSEIQFKTLFDILDAVESAGNAGEQRDLSPLVITYNMDPVPWTKSLEQVIQVASAAVSIAIPVAGSIASASVLTTLQAVQDNLNRLMKVVGGMGGGDMVSIALDLGATFLPSQYQQYVTPAKSAYKAVVGKNPSEALKALQLLSQTSLGQQATAWGKQLVDGINIDIGGIAKVASKPFDFVRQQIATLQVGHMIGKVAELTASDVEFAKQLFKIDRKAISEVSYLSTFVTSLAGGKHPSTVPNLGGLSRMVAMSGELLNVLDGRIESARSDAFATLSLLGMGFAAPCVLFRDLAYQSFRQQAEKLQETGVKTIATPALVGAEDSECFAYRVRQDVPGVEVLYGEPPKTGTTITTPTTTSTTTTTTTVGIVSPPTIHTDGGTPSTGTPVVGVPSTGTPWLNPPKLDTPQVPITPQINLPGIQLPETQVPKVDPPRVEIPKIEVPKVEPPKVEPPKVEPPRTDWNTPIIRPPECPSGYTLINGECIPPPPPLRTPQCPPGYTLMGNECVPPPPTIRSPQCPPGLTLIGNECVPPPPTIRNPQCPPGYTIMGNECVPPPPNLRSPQCPPGYVLSGNECLPPPPTIRQPQCPDGYTLVGNECIPPPPPVREPEPPKQQTPPYDWNPQPPAPPQQPPQLPPRWPPQWPPQWQWPPAPPCGGSPCGGCNGCDSCD